MKSGEVNDYRISSTEESITDLALSQSAAKRIPAGSTLVAMYGATAGVVGLLEVEAATNQAVAALIPTGRITSRYLFFATQAGASRLMRRTQGSGQPNLNGKMLKDLRLPIPPLHEQSQIAQCFESLDEEAETMHGSLQSLRHTKAGLLQDLLTGKVRVSV